MRARATPWNAAVAKHHLANRETITRLQGIRICEGCGCSENNACCRLPDGTTREGCHWISATRCSECPPSETPATDPTARTADLQELQFMQYLKAECGYFALKPLPDNRWAGLQRFAFTTAIIVGVIGDRVGHANRYCFHDASSAQTALEAWDGSGDPDGWHREIRNGRRRPDGDPSREYVQF